MLEFKVNKYLSVKLENSKTNIYVNGEFFIICKFLLIDLPYSNSIALDELLSIDELELDNSLEGSDPYDYKITPEIEFWGHCSNLQVWAENGYNTNLLHRNLAFPLLKKLTEAGDPVAKKVFKEEIARRFSSGFKPVVLYLLRENYLKFLNEHELDTLLDSIKGNQDLFNKISLLKEKPLKFIHYVDETRSIIKCALCYIIKKIDGQYYVFGYYSSIYDNSFFAFLNEGNFHNLIFFNNYITWKAGYKESRKGEWNNKNDISKEMINSMIELFNYILKSIKNFFYYDGKSILIREKYINTFKRLGSSNDYIYASDDFNKEYLFYLSKHWDLPFSYKPLKMKE
jgi:hypothetical protein